MYPHAPPQRFRVFSRRPKLSSGTPKTSSTKVSVTTPYSSTSSVAVPMLPESGSDAPHHRISVRASQGVDHACVCRLTSPQNRLRRSLRRFQDSS